MAADLGATYTGISNIDSIPIEQRIFDRDKVLIRIARGNLGMSRIMLENFRSKTYAAKDPEPKWKQDVDRNIIAQAGAASTTVSGFIHKIWIKDKYASMIDEGGFLAALSIFYGSNTFATTQSASQVQREMMLVKERGISNGTNTWFIVQRGFAPADGSTTGTPPALASGDNLVYMPRAVAEGNNEGRIWGDTPDEDYNYCEFNLQKWGVNIVVQNTNIYQDESVEERNGRRTNDQFWKGFEIKLIEGRRNKETDANGDTIWRTGGAIEYILQPQTKLGYLGDNVVNFSGTYGPMSYQNFNRAFVDKFFYGNRQEKWLILDVAAYAKICNAFDNKIRIYNKELSGKYGINIETIMTSGGGMVHLVVHDLLSILGYTNQALLMDFDHFKYMHLQNLDTQIVMNAEKAMNLFKTVNYMFQMAGVKRTNPFAHWLFFNL